MDRRASVAAKGVVIMLRLLFITFFALLVVPVAAQQPASATESQVLPKLAPAAPTVWAQEPTSFFQIGFGQPLSDSLRDCPTVDAETTLAMIRSYSKLVCVQRSGAIKEIRGLQGFWGVFVEEVHGAVALLTANFSEFDRQKIAASLVARFGPPSVDKIEDWQSKAGVHAQNHILIWLGRDIIIEYESVGNKIDEGFLDVSNAAHREMLRQQERDHAKAIIDQF